VLLEFVGLAVDIGYLQWQRLKAQVAADAAANGAVIELRRGSNSQTIVTAGQADAALNGFTNGANSATVTINNPPQNGSLAGNSSAVEAIVTAPVNTFFLAVVGLSQATVSARAVSMIGAGTGGGCVYALSATASRAFQIDGGNTDYLSCGLSVASSSSTALHMEGSAVLYMKNNAGVSVVGGLDLTGQTKILNFNTGKSVTPTKLSSLSDPLASVAAPSTNGMTVRSMTNKYYDMNAKPTNNTIQPGVYCGGLTIGNTGSNTFTLASGVYVMAGGGFIFNSQAKITGAGVTIYTTSGANSGVAGCNSAYSPFTIDGGAQVSLSAPTSGSLEGILIFQDRSITTSVASQFVGNSNTTMNGAIYLLHAPLTYSGTNSAGGYQILVTDTLTVSGNSTLNNDYSSLQDGSPIRQNVLLAE
jgi:hypothetical protein